MGTEQKPKQQQEQQKSTLTMNFSSTIAITFFSLHFFEYFLSSAFAFTPVINANINHNTIHQQKAPIRQQGSKLNYVQEVQMHGVTLILEKDLSAVINVADIPLHENKDDFIDSMEEAFDNMRHPMELMLLNRACIPYVAM